MVPGGAWTVGLYCDAWSGEVLVNVRVTVWLPASDATAMLGELKSLGSIAGSWLQNPAEVTSWIWPMAQPYASQST